MTRMTRATLAVAALGLALAGCTGSSDEDPQAEATPQDEWAASLCEALEPTTEPVDPPATEGANAADSKQAIVTFLQTLHDRLDAQAAVLKDVGPPPEADPAPFKKARKSLSTGAKTLDDVIGRLKDADPKDASQLQDTLLQVSETLANSASYQGPLAELGASDEKLAKAFENNTDCVSIMS